MSFWNQVRGHECQPITGAYYGAIGTGALHKKKGKIVSDICGLFVSKKGLYILVHMGVFVSSSIHGA